MTDGSLHSQRSDGQTELLQGHLTLSSVPPGFPLFGRLGQCLSLDFSSLRGRRSSALPAPVSAARTGQAGRRGLEGFLGPYRILYRPTKGMGLKRSPSGHCQVQRASKEAASRWGPGRQGQQHRGETEAGPTQAFPEELGSL